MGWQDTFAGRTLPASWGNSSDGQTWNVLGGTSALSVGSGQGLIAAPASVQIMRLGVNTGADLDGSVRWSVTNNADQMGIHLRLTDAVNYYRLDIGSFGLNNMRLGKKTGGGFVQVALASTPITINLSTLYWLRFRVVGANLYGRVWQDGQPEPGQWHISALDTSVLSGGVGLFANPTGAVAFDSFSVNSVSQGGLGIGNHKAFGRFL